MYIHSNLFKIHLIIQLTKSLIIAVGVVKSIDKIATSLTLFLFLLNSIQIFFNQFGNTFMAVTL